MSVLLQFNDIHKSYGTRKLLDGASASFLKGQKIGMIGRNGAGKSTLCKILIGQDTQDSGTITTNSELRLSYLEQHDPYEESETIIDFLARYTNREEWECAEMAAKFQIGYDLIYNTIGSLAGGYRTRVKLTAMLLRQPNFLILDEPTNYLDLSTLIILENFLLRFNGGYLIVSHDREFLKKTCDHTLEVDQGIVTLYPGSIEDYFEYKEQNLAQKVAYNRTIEKKKEQLQDFVDRFKAKASKATAAKSKMKQIAKLKTIEIAHVAGTVKIVIPAVEFKSGIALQCFDLKIGYPGKEIASDINLEIDRGERIAILGDNGQGKTTFMRTIVGDLESRGGEIKWGAGLQHAYYAQHVFKTLHPEDEVVTHLSREAADGVSRQDVLDMAGCFLFKGDDVQKKVKVLSGGERARLILAGLLLRKSQVLLLDEPTNHLDFETVEALAEALKKYNGTVFFICHDRTFVNMVATTIVDVGGGKIVRYPGTYEDYVYSLEMKAQEQLGDDPASRKKADKKGSKQQDSEDDDGTSNSGDDASEGLSDVDRKKMKAELNKLQGKSRKLEVRIGNLTGERDKLLKDMEENPFFYNEDRNAKMRQITISLEEAEDEWMKLLAKIEKIEKKIN